MPVAIRIQFMMPLLGHGMPATEQCLLFCGESGAQGVGISWLFLAPATASALEASSAMHADAQQVINIDEGELFKALRAQPIVINLWLTTVNWTPSIGLAVKEMPAHDDSGCITVITALKKWHY